MKTYVYIDGFNLYYRALKNTPYKWLNVATLCQLLLPRNQIHQINYYTAHVTARPNDLGQPIRQQTYLRALRTLPNLSIVLGTFLTSEVWALKAGNPPSQIEYVKIVKTEEKGSDVNLAAHLLRDGFQQRYEAAVVITNDSDLVEPVKIVRRELGLPVGILSPSQHPNPKLVQAASFIRPIRAGLFAPAY